MRATTSLTLLATTAGLGAHASPAATTATAATTVLNLWGGMDSQTLVGSIVSIVPGGSATAVAVACASGTDSEDCGIDGTLTLTQGPHTWALATTFVEHTIDYGSETDYYETAAATATDEPEAVTADTTYTITEGCSFSGVIGTATGAIGQRGLCSYTQVAEGVTSSTTVVLDPTDVELVPVTVTAGVEKLTATGAAATAAASSGSSASWSASGSASGSGSAATTVATSTAASGNGTASASSMQAGAAVASYGFGVTGSLAAVGVLVVALAL